MKLKFRNSRVTSGYGHDLESFAFGKSRFTPQITFDNDDGAGGNGGGVATEPAPADQAPPAEDVSGLKSALQKERDRAKALEKQFSQLQDSFKGIDAEKYKQFEKLQEEADRANQREAELKQSLEAQFTTQIQDVQVKLQKAEQRYASLEKKTQVEKIYQNGAVKGRTEAAEDGSSYFDIVYTHAQNFLRTNEKGQLEVVDANGTKRYSIKDASKPMSPIELFEELRNHPIYAMCFQPANNAKGGGMVGSNGVRQSGREDLTGLSGAEKLNRMRAAMQ